MSGGRLELRIVEARQLFNAHKINMPDPYCMIHMGSDRKFKTEHIKNSVAPVWNATCSFDVRNPEADILHLEMLDKCTLKDKRMGNVDVALHKLVKGAVVDKWFVLNNAPSGEIRVRLHAVDFGLPPDNAAPVEPPPLPAGPDLAMMMGA
eukprot:TRINITY_DN28231_c0_g1_i1.p2 TRINITY_DN28231_c0_g1~~TRINITY_DN28231_c0_g1_i1.p2  ORF type:complete len:150 (+),score=57.32 TRINITY_DN28231_c0_g1_i1:62-511(+)